MGNLNCGCNDDSENKDLINNDVKPPNYGDESENKIKARTGKRMNDLAEYEPEETTPKEKEFTLNKVIEKARSEGATSNVLSVVEQTVVQVQEVEQTPVQVQEVEVVVEDEEEEETFNELIFSKKVFAALNAYRNNIRNLENEVRKKSGNQEVLRDLATMPDKLKSYLWHNEGHLALSNANSEGTAGIYSNAGITRKVLLEVKVIGKFSPENTALDAMLSNWSAYKALIQGGDASLVAIASKGVNNARETLMVFAK